MTASEVSPTTSYETNISTKETPPDACSRFPFTDAEQERSEGSQTSDVQGPRPSDCVAALDAGGQPVAEGCGLCGSVVGRSVAGRQAIRHQGSTQRLRGNPLRLFGKQAYRELRRSQSSKASASRGGTVSVGGGRIRYRDCRPQRSRRSRFHKNRTFNSQSVQARPCTSASGRRRADEPSRQDRRDGGRWESLCVRRPWAR